MSLFRDTLSFFLPNIYCAVQCGWSIIIYKKKHIKCKVFLKIFFKKIVKCTDNKRLPKKQIQLAFNIKRGYNINKLIKKEKSKPSENLGRKATRLKRKAMPVELPKEQEILKLNWQLNQLSFFVYKKVYAVSSSDNINVA